jgi:putative OPT family oligopeptide transporter
VLSVVSAVIVGAILNMGICYSGLQIGFTIVGSTVAAVLGFGLLRGVLRRGSILEVNIFQTVASSVNTVNAGVIFTVPVLFLLGKEAEIDYASLVLATAAGSILGVVMIIPMRKQIIDFERLRFPEGVATATILKSPGAGVEKAKLLITAILISALVLTLTKIPMGEGTVLPDHFRIGQLLGLPSGFRLVFALSLLSLGAGYLAGRHGLVILYGTILNFWVLIPVCVVLGWVPAEFADFAFLSTDAADYARAEKLAGAFAVFTSRNVGIGMILGGAVAGIVVAFPALKAALASLRTTPTTGEREEVPMSVLSIGMVLGLLMLLVAAKLSGGEHVSWGTAALVAVVGGAWLWLAGLVVAQTTGRTDWSPLSGLALIAIAILMGIMGTGDEMIVPAVTIGAAICVATSMCADMMADLKTGYLVGSRPIKQQIAQIGTCWIGPPIALFTVILLWEAYAFGPDQAQILHDRAVADGVAVALEAGATATLPPGTPALGAPQAGALKAAINIVQSGDVALGKYVTGALLGLVISLLVSPGLGVMIGLSLYLPFEYMIVFGLGGIISILVTRAKGARWAEDKGVPVAAGLIVGDALVGIVDALLKVGGSLV